MEAKDILSWNWVETIENEKKEKKKQKEQKMQNKNKQNERFFKCKTNALAKVSVLQKG